jgi:hypothetical protein
MSATYLVGGHDAQDQEFEQTFSDGGKPFVDAHGFLGLFAS